MRAELKSLGLPMPLVRIAEDISKSLPAIEGRAFLDALLEGVGTDGKDLSRVHWAFLAAELRALPATEGDVKTVIDRVILGMDLLASGRDWPDASAAVAAAARAVATRAESVEAWAAFEAADSAMAARAAAAATRAGWAACAAALAAEVSGAARIRQRDTLLSLIAEAPVQGVK